MRLPNSEVTVTVNCGDAIHDVTLRDGAFVTAAHNIDDLHLERVAYGFDPTFEMCGCASLLHTWITGDRDRLPSPWWHLHDDADQRRWQRELFPDSPHRFYDPIGRNGDTWEDTIRAWRLTQRYATVAATAFLDAQTDRFRTVGGGNRSVHVTYQDGRFCYLDGKMDTTGIGVNVKVHPRWVRDVARHGLATPSVATHWFVTDVTGFNDDGTPATGRAAAWRTGGDNWRRTERRTERRTTEAVVRGFNVKFERDDNTWVVQPLPVW